jgi:hypothetical protein
MTKQLLFYSLIYYIITLSRKKGYQGVLRNSSSALITPHQWA